MKADYISPHEGTWVSNDFTQDDEIVVDDRVCTVLCHNEMHYQDLELTVKWSDTGKEGRVWPNMQWVALNWTDAAVGEEQV